jgi:subtilisin family serine protease
MFESEININNEYQGIINNKETFVRLRFIPPYSGSYEVICNADGLLCGAIYDVNQNNYANGAYTNNKAVIRLASTLLRDNLYYLELHTSQHCKDDITYSLHICKIPTPNISHFKYQWGMLNRKSGLDINILPVWKYIYSSDIYVGVADTGVNYNHINLQKNINKSLSYNFVHEEQEVYPENESGDEYAAHSGHGTYVAGLISGYPKDDIGILGVVNTPNTIALKVLGNSKKNCPVFNKASDAFVLAIEYAARNNIRILNCSFSGREFSEQEKRAIENAKDILFVMAAGNKGVDTGSDPFYPACYNVPNSIVVAAVDQYGLLYEKSNYGACVDIGAPGEDIASVYMDDQYIKVQGTSAAAPFVSGVCALILEKNPKLLPYEVKQIVTHSDNITKINGLKGKVKCEGIIIAYKSIIADATGLIK